MKFFKSVCLSVLSFTLLNAHQAAWGAQAQADAPKPHRLIITDVDDTVKLTDNAHALDSFVRAAFSRKAFAGMSTLFRELGSQNDSSDLFGHSTTYFVTAGPRVLRKAIVDLISENGFPSPWALMLRDLSLPVVDYKIQKISQIIERLAPEDQVMLLGDDGDQGPEIYAKLLQKYPNRIESIYIHRIKGRDLPAGEVAYDTPMDIALLEMEKGRLKAEQAIRVGSAVLAESAEDDDKLVLHYNYCPVSFEIKNPTTVSPERIVAYSLSTQIQGRIKQVCEKRREDEARRLEGSDS